MQSDDLSRHGPLARNMGVWADLIAASRDLVQAVELALKARRFPPLGWYDVLLELKREAPEGLRQNALQERLLLPQYALSRLIDRIEESGYVSRQRCPRDGRAQIIRITEAGLEIQARMWPVYRDTVRRIFAEKLTGPEIAALASILRKIRV